MSDTALYVIMTALSIIWFMWRRIKGNLDHLEDEDIQDFLAKRLSDKELKQVREHILRCPACKLRLDELSKEAHKMKPDRWLKRRF